MLGRDPDGAATHVAQVLAVSQRPLAAVVFQEPAPVAAWKSKPSWGIRGAGDRTINPEVERFGYERGGFRASIELDAPHLVMYTHPTEIADVIETAVRAVSSDV